MSDKRFRIAILDDFEKLADTVSAYEKLKVAGRRDYPSGTTGFAGENRANSERHGRVAAHA